MPYCLPYAIQSVKGSRRARNQHGVVRAVQEWLTESHPELAVLHTLENFTRESLARDGFDYDLVITSTYNPSWFIFKPLGGAWLRI